MEKKNIYSLLSENNLVVPEIQREYVWGSAKNKRVLQQFSEDLDIKLNNGIANVGFLYTYNSGVENYLIDGQQRFTSILLLLFFLSVKEGPEKHQSFLNILKANSNLQAFSYRVRSYTESFFSNLIQHTSISSKAVEDQTWFKMEYKDDPTIGAMLGALDVFEDIMKKTSNLTYDRILNDVYFWYFDVEQTSQGEELYITMNSRGEKLTDSEQIKPRLLRKEVEKESYGKKWDDWEEYFYADQLRSGRGIGTIDTAMNNVIRIVLELKTNREHDRIKPVEDADLISLADVETYMNGIKSIGSISEGRYKSEIIRLYGDSSSDQNFYVLKALLTESIKGQQDLHEYERVYQTILNHARRNKLKNIDFLNFLNEYKESKCQWYEYILNNEDNVTRAVFFGHELEKIKICANYGDSTEKSIWAVQSLPFWNGEIKALINWSKVGENFSSDEFSLISTTFNQIFDKTENAGWTGDNIRQALLAYGISNYPIDNRNFGYKSADWKRVFLENSNIILKFIHEFDNTDIESKAKEIIDKNTEDSAWGDFIKEPALLGYLNTKHLSWDDKYGYLLVKNSWAQPVSVKNMLLKCNIEKCLDLQGFQGWTCRIWQNWNSCVVIENEQKNIAIDIRYFRQYPDKNGEIYNILLFKRNSSPDEIRESLKQAQEEEYEFKDQINRYEKNMPYDNKEIVVEIKELLSIL